MRPFLLLALWLLSSALFGAPLSPQWPDSLKLAVAPRLPARARIEVQIARVPATKAEGWKITAFSPDQPLGLVNFEAEANIEGRWIRGQGSATVRAYVPVAVATSPIAHGDPLDVNNLRFEERELSRLTQTGYFVDKTVVGRRAKGSITIGQVIGRHNSAQQPLVTPGETVDLVRRKGSLTLSAKVRALQGGVVDQWVQVQNPSSGKLFLARISGPGEVEIR
jgi:flagella basal body P-ring formation protein FlgA